jgi:PAS domain S-box-containing protein
MPRRPPPQSDPKPLPVPNAADSLALSSVASDADNRRWLIEVQQASRIGFWEHDYLTGNTFWSEEIFRLMGFDPAQGVPSEKERWGRILPEDAARVRVQRARVIAENVSFESDYRIRLPEGTIRWIHGRGRVIRDADGKPLRFIGTSQDVTERKQLEAALTEAAETLAEREAQLRRVGDNLPDGFVYTVILTPNGGRRFEYISAGVERMTGLSPDSVTENAIHFYDRILSEDRYRVGRTESEAMRTLSRFDVETRYHASDNEIRWWHIRAMPRPLPDGSVAWDGFITDCTERKQLEEESRITLSRYELATQGSLTGIWDWRKETNEFFRTDHWKTIHGYVGEYAAEAPPDPSYCTHPDDLAAMRVRFTEFLEGRETEYESINRSRHRDGSWRWILSRARALRHPDGRAYRISGIYTDITEQKEREERAKREAMRQERIAYALQNTLLTTPAPDAFPAIELHTLYQPVTEEALIGGDFFDTLPLPDGRVALIVGDVTGKGLRAAALTAEAKYLLRGFVYEYAGTPSIALERMNRLLNEMAARTTGRGLGGDSFVTLTVAVLEADASAVRFAVAGMPPPMILRNTPTGLQIVEVNSGGPPVGMIDDWYADALPDRFALAPGDTLLLYTDGLSEIRRRVPSGKPDIPSSLQSNLESPFGAESVLRVAQRLQTADGNKSIDLAAFSDTLLHDALNAAEGFAHDDICLLLARRR